MSKLTDQLAALGQSSGRFLGFGRSERARHNAAILLLGEVTHADAGSEIEKAAGLVDAFILAAGAGAPVPPAEALEACKGTIWGVAGHSAAADDLDALKGAGCDFLLVNDYDAPATVLRDDGMARGLTIRPGLSEESARAVEDLPFEFLVLEADVGSWPISLASLMRLQATVSMVSKHVLLKVRRLPAPDSLPLLRDMPISGLLVDLSSVGRAALADARKAVEELEPRRPRQPAEQTQALIPPLAAGTSVGADSGGDEDWDDNDDQARTQARLRREAIRADSRGLP
ncbi:MAG: hypothetical protein FJ313_08000 [Gemmatimonadetes bacterium]|nr:hypothetical protein [Gemmatimonadota bacterium]